MLLQAQFCTIDWTASKTQPVVRDIYKGEKCKALTGGKRQIS